MTEVRLTAADGHELGAYAAVPSEVKGGVVVLHEIFGVTGHIRSVVDGFAAAGYATIAPALFDRVRPDIKLDYSDMASGKELVGSIAPQLVIQDVAVAVDWARAHGKVAIVGFCWGGTLAFLSAAALPINAAVAYYGGMIAKMLDRTPKVPVLYHFGGKDAFIPADDIQLIRAAAETAGDRVFVYPTSGHGFNCGERADYNERDAAAAMERTLKFLEETLSA